MAFLSLSGSLNPVHTQHMRALEAARDALHGQGWTVVAGFITPSGEKFVEQKLGADAWPLDTRIRLCELACVESDWVDVCASGEFRSYRLCAALREYLERECVELKGHSLTGIEVMGSDTAIRILDGNIADWDSSGARVPWYQRRVVCCLLRPGRDYAFEMAHIQKHTARRAADLGVEVVVVDPDSIHPPLEAVSSSEIRKLLAEGELEQLRARKWLHPGVLTALNR